MWSKFKGTGVAIVTPFNNDFSIDYTGLGNLIHHLIDGGVDYLVVQGTTGESVTLSKKEKQEVLSFVYDKVAGRLPIILGIGGNNTTAVADDFNAFDSDLFDAILSVSPYYNKPTQEGIFKHYAYLAERAPKPIMLYNVPGRTGSNIAASTTLELANEFDNILGIKEASGNFQQITTILENRPDDFLVISGDDGITTPMISLGADGVVSVVANAFPSQFSEMVNAGLNGDFIAARTIQNQLNNITNLMFSEGNPAGVKATLEILEICGKDVRLPLVQMSPEGVRSLTEEVNLILT